MINWIIILIVLLATLIITFVCIYFTRLQTISTIEKITKYKDYNLYRMNIKYNYNLNNVINYGINDTQSLVNAIVKESMPLLPIHMKIPDFGCSAFSVTDVNKNILMGRNYDFKNNSSAMLLYCSPKNSYKSVAFAALDNISANNLDNNIKNKFACLATPFVCLDGMNEKGVTIAVLTLDSKPIHQITGKPSIATSLAIRLVLDKAATTKEAVNLLGQYDMVASAGRDYHFYIADSSGDSRVIEYDCNSKTRNLVATPVCTVTNFFEIYNNKVLPNQKNGIYGHGKERYNIIEKILNKNKGTCTVDIAWEALKASSQSPKEDDITSNTQWSIVYNNTNLTAEIAIRRDWNTITSYDLKNNTLK